jgi:hypothetical protein
MPPLHTVERYQEYEQQIWKNSEMIVTFLKTVSYNFACSDWRKPHDCLYRGVALGYRLDVGGSNTGRSWEFFFSPLCPNRLCDPPSLLSNGYQWF